MDSIGVWQRSTADRLFFSCQSEHRHHIIIMFSKSKTKRFPEDKKGFII